MPSQLHMRLFGALFVLFAVAFNGVALGIEDLHFGDFMAEILGQLFGYFFAGVLAHVFYAAEISGVGLDRIRHIFQG